jgi:hypothetical protein
VLGMTPIGSLFAAGLVVLLNRLFGTTGTPFGARYTVAIGGLLSLAGVIYFIVRLPALRKAAHPMLERAGVFPQIATGLESTEIGARARG